MPTDFDTIIQLVNTVGVVGVLVFALIAFYRGNIIPRTVLDEVIAAVVKNVLAELDR